MSEQTTIARPYAKAAFDFAVEQGAITEWHDMLEFAAAVAVQEDMHHFLKSATSRDQVTNVFVGVCGEQLNANGQNLIKVMADNERLVALPEVARLFALLRADYEKEVTVDVVSAVELNDALAAKLSAALEKRLARKVKLNCSVDPSVMGGLLIEAGDLVIDGTLKSKLTRLANTLQS
ncbi:F0F1 ATP synthase subunit delta [Aliidiomarina halalkaliphila]|uniref:ATP synthase subunit delta n=1 Tax=Aliidiomarina halalkaliphila TaxID=2593535 RepID=A0A552X1A6_9GAMM|nr:F0F1 ATP synthase subunit delta [Aliidiomarina halalkaliphila]TRW48726.1 F0F1 ATP synthase subunit delta [Aliidiomarina halalkaliphila]